MSLSVTANAFIFWLTGLSAHFASDFRIENILRKKSNDKQKIRKLNEILQIADGAVGGDINNDDDDDNGNNVDYADDVHKCLTGAISYDLKSNNVNN